MTTDLIRIVTADKGHAGFQSSFDTVTDELAAGVATLLKDGLDEEVPDRLDLTEQFDARARDNLRDARRVVGIIDLLAVALPLAALVLTSRIYLVSRSETLTLVGTGLSVSIGVLPTLLAGAVLPSRLDTVIGQIELPPAVRNLVLSVIDQVIDAVLLQSSVVVGAGLVWLGAGLILYVGVITPPACDNRT